MEGQQGCLSSIGKVWRRAGREHWGQTWAWIDPLDPQLFTICTLSPRWVPRPRHPCCPPLASAPLSTAAAPHTCVLDTAPLQWACPQTLVDPAGLWLCFQISGGLCASIPWLPLFQASCEPVGTEAMVCAPERWAQGGRCAAQRGAGRGGGVMGEQWEQERTGSGTGADEPCSGEGVYAPWVDWC